MAVRITENCIVPDMPAEVYHADPCVEPSASRSFVNTLVRRSPRHAMIGHPRLNPNFERDEAQKFDLGNAAHDYILSGGTAIEVIQADDYRTNAAKAARDAIIAAGRRPVLAHQMGDILDMAEMAKLQIAGIEGHEGGLQNGQPEPSIFWRDEEHEAWCRARPDWIANDGWIDDYKTTDIASPRQWIEGVFVDKGYHLQAYMNLRGYHAVTGHNAKGFRFFVQEVKEPFALYCVVVDATMLEVAEADFAYGMDIFARCLKSGSWPAYSREPYLALPSFRANRAYEDVKEARHKLEMPAKASRILYDWQAPITRKKA